MLPDAPPPPIPGVVLDPLNPVNDGATSDQIITIVGNNFLAKDVLNRAGTRTGLQVLINGDSTTAEFVDSNALRFLAPLKSSAIVVKIEVAMNGIDSTSSGLTLNYVSNSNAACAENCLNRGQCVKLYIEDLTSPTFEKEVYRCLCTPPFFGFVCADGGFALVTFLPGVVFQSGGATVGLNDFNLASSVTNIHRCKFGNQVVNATLSATTGLISVMTCPAPPLFLNASVALSISIDGGKSWAGHPSLHQISYMMLPLAANVAPSIAPFNGGT